MRSNPSPSLVTRSRRPLPARGRAARFALSLARVALGLGLIALLLLAALPLLVGAAAPTLLSFAGVRGTNTAVSLEAGPLSLLGGAVDRLTFSSTDLDLAGRGHAGSLQATLSGLSVPGRRFVDSQISATDITFTTANDGQPFSMRSISGSGPSSAIAVRAFFDRADLLSLLALEGADKYSGGTTSGLTLGTDHFVLQTSGGAKSGALSIAAGAVVFTPDQGPAQVVYTPKAGAVWHLTGVTIAPTGVTLTGTVDLTRLLNADATAGQIFDQLVPR